MRGLRPFVAIAAALVLGVLTHVPGASSFTSGGAATAAMTDVRVTDVASQAGLTFRQGAFRYGVARDDEVAMMGGGLCWLDYDRDGWLDLFVVNSYSERDTERYERNGGLPRSALFHNVKGKFVDVSRRVRCRPRRSRDGVRGRRPRPGRTHRSVRHHCRDERPALEQRQRHVQRRRLGGRGCRLGLAHVCRGRRRQRRRPARSLRRRLHGSERSDLRLRRGIPDEPRGRSRPALPQPGSRQGAACPLPRGWPPGGPRDGAVRPHARSGLLRSRPRRSSRPLCRERRGPEPALRERQLARRRQD